MESPGLEEFVEEVDEILQDLEQGILQLEAQPSKEIPCRSNFSKYAYHQGRCRDGDADRTCGLRT